MQQFGIPELLFVLAIVFVMFGPRKIGEFGKGLGEGIRGFKSSLQETERRPTDKK